MSITINDIDAATTITTLGGRVRQLEAEVAGHREFGDKAAARAVAAEQGWNNAVRDLARAQAAADGATETIRRLNEHNRKLIDRTADFVSRVEDVTATIRGFLSIGANTRKELLGKLEEILRDYDDGLDVPPGADAESSPSEAT